LQADDVPEKMDKTSEFWKCLLIDEYESFISDLVIAELNKCPEPKKSHLEAKCKVTVPRQQKKSE